MGKPLNSSVFEPSVVHAGHMLALLVWDPSESRHRRAGPSTAGRVSTAPGRRHTHTHSGLAPPEGGSGAPPEARAAAPPPLSHRAAATRREPPCCARPAPPEQLPAGDGAPSRFARLNFPSCRQHLCVSPGRAAAPPPREEIKLRL